MRIALFLLTALALRAADYPAPVQGDFVLHDFRFHTGEVLPDLKLHYNTVGKPTGEPVLILHGTNGNGANFLRPEFAEQLFGPGQPLDANKYYIILPDAIGAGKSSKPSDGMRASFPQYNYDDIVRGQYRLVNEHLGLRHLRSVIGNSMGGMLTWLWVEMYPDFMDLAVPMASEPAAMAGRNWMMRRMVVDAIRKDPEWRNGNYEKQPAAFRTAQTFFGIATSGGALAMYNTYPTGELADKELDKRLAQTRGVDANDVLYQMDGSRDYDPSKGLDKIHAAVLAINSADDERNPAELGVMEAAMKKITNGKYVLLPIGPDSRGHGTTGNAKLWKQYLAEALAQTSLQAAK